MSSYGNFDSLNLPQSYRERIESAFQAVSSIEGGWEFLNTYEPGKGGFMLSAQPAKMDEIEKEVLKRFEGHSGGSYGDTMRVIQYIAKYGWEYYAKEMKEKYGFPKEKEDKKSGFPYPCPCHQAQGKEGWCGVAGGGVPACDH